eukprot:1120438-Amphidinium_carterae.2
MHVTGAQRMESLGASCHKAPHAIQLPGTAGGQGIESRSCAVQPLLSDDVPLLSQTWRSSAFARACCSPSCSPSSSQHRAELASGGAQGIVQDLCIERGSDHRLFGGAIPWSVPGVTSPSSSWSSPFRPAGGRAISANLRAFANGAELPGNLRSISDASWRTIPRSTIRTADAHGNQAAWQMASREVGQSIRSGGSLAEVRRSIATGGQTQISGSASLAKWAPSSSDSGALRISISDPQDPFYYVNGGENTFSWRQCSRPWHRRQFSRALGAATSFVAFLPCVCSQKFPRITRGLRRALPTSSPSC